MKNVLRRSDRTEDELMQKLSQSIVNNGDYRWDLF